MTIGLSIDGGTVDKQGTLAHNWRAEKALPTPRQPWPQRPVKEVLMVARSYTTDIPWAHSADPHRARYRDITGMRFGRWRVVRLDANVRHSRGWLCRCDCGAERVVASGSLIYGSSRSCGCLAAEGASAVCVERNFSHGMSKVPEYRIWKDIRRRCLNRARRAYRNYGARGISICPEWRDSFVAFLRDVGARPGPDLTIDRINNDGDYEPGNVRWATRKVQRRNSRAVRLIEIDGARRPLFEWLEVLGRSRGLYKSRKRRGWTDEEALLTAPGASRA